jgi:acyl-CoA thioesterase
MAAGEHGLDAATTLRPLGGGEYEASLDDAWWVDGTGYGGYLAAVLARASSELDAAAGQRLLSSCVQFHAPTEAGRALVRVRALAGGRSSGGVLAELVQGGVTRTAALSCFGRMRSGPRRSAAPPVAAPPPSDCPPLTVRPQVRARFRLADRFERRRLPATAGVDTGGWIRFAEPRPLDPVGVLALLDSWTAAATAHARVERMLTLSYFVQLLAPLTAGPGDFLLATFRCDAMADGYAEDAGELRDASGVLLARSRQVVCVAR